MKRSKLFLSITGGLLAIAGVAAAKAHHFNSFVAAIHNPGCVVYNSGTAIPATNVQNQQSTLKTLKTTSGKILYSYHSALACAQKLFTTGE